MNLEQKRKMLKVIYDYRNYSTDSQRSELLDYLLATANYKNIKGAIEHLDIKL